MGNRKEIRLCRECMQMTNHEVINNQEYKCLKCGNIVERRFR